MLALSGKNDRTGWRRNARPQARPRNECTATDPRTPRPDPGSPGRCPRTHGFAFLSHFVTICRPFHHRYHFGSSPFQSRHTFSSPRMSFFAAWIRRYLVCTLASATPLVAQQIETVPVDVRVRLTLRDSVRAQPFTRQTTPLIGTVISSTANDFTLAVGARDTVRITRPSIRSVQISRGASRRRSAITRWIKGGVVGTLRRGEASERVLGAAIGTGLGVVIGLLSPYEHWRSFRW